MKKLLFASALMILLGFSAKSQDYKTAIGMRGGLSQGLTVKQFMGSNVAVEGIFAIFNRSMYITGLYEIHKASAFGVDRLNWYYGGGAHAGTYHYVNDNNPDIFSIGIDGILGIEYNLTEIPISISIDLKPAYNLVGWRGNTSGGALSIRYML